MISIAFILIILIFVYWVKNENKYRLLPPGKYGWPIIGFIPSLKIPIWEQVEESRRQLGDIFMWKIGNRKIVFLCNSKLVKTAFQNQAFSFRSIGIPLNRQFGKEPKDRSQYKEQEFQIMMKKLSQYHLMNVKKRENVLEEILGQEQRDFMKSMEDGGDEKNLSDVLDEMKLSTFNVIFNIITGVKYSDIITKSDMKEVLKSFSTLWNDFTNRAVFLNLFPKAQFIIDRIFPTVNVERLNVYKFLMRMYYLMNETEESSGIMNTFLNYRKNKFPEDGEIKSEEVLMICKNILLAGQATTVTAFYHILYQMAIYPEIQAKVRAEIDANIPCDRYPCSKDKSQLQYTQAVIYESLRRFSPGPFGLFHRVTEDSFIDNYLIPKDALILPSIYSCHHDPKFWDNPKKFNPQNFFEKNGNKIKINESFLPFSKGLRSCPGANIAELLLFIWFTTVIQNFTLSTPNDGKLDDLQYEKFFIELKLAKINIKFHRRKLA